VLVCSLCQNAFTIAHLCCLATRPNNVIIGFSANFLSLSVFTSLFRLFQRLGIGVALAVSLSSIYKRSEKRSNLNRVYRWESTISKIRLIKLLTGHPYVLRLFSTVLFAGICRNNFNLMSSAGECKFKKFKNLIQVLLVVCLMNYLLPFTFLAGMIKVGY